MSVYVDNLRNSKISVKWTYSKSCHLTADSDDELLSFAVVLGLKRTWLQISKRKMVKHFDLCSSMRTKALSLGAIER